LSTAPLTYCVLPETVSGRSPESIIPMMRRKVSRQQAQVCLPSSELHIHGEEIKWTY
jgi:hypothetical protein